MTEREGSQRSVLASTFGWTVALLGLISLANFRHSFIWTKRTTTSLPFFDKKAATTQQQLSVKNKSPLVAVGDVSLVAKAVAENSATGTIFDGRPFRSYHRTATTKSTTILNDDSSWFRLSGKSNQCTKWSVVTTINGPSQAVISMGQIPDWCTVIIADTKTPDNYLDLATEWTAADRQRIHYISVDLQREWEARAGSVVAQFIKAIPYRHFARKNIGYLYAIHQGAKLIYDFDDDNILLSDKNGKSLSPLADEQFLRNARIVATGMVLFNHHPLMGASEPDSWARGFPLSLIRNNHTRGFEAFQQNVPMGKLAVVQICANSNPDIDAIHRLTKPLPMHFDPRSAPVIVPPHALAPYNAQATVHTVQAAFALLLPSTVPGRVSDIWRSYFAQALFRPLDLRVAFVAPRVWQDRNEHDLKADFQAEGDLYHKTEALVEFLSTWQSTAPHIATRMEELWIDLYERGYIEIEELAALQHWLAALKSINYDFPKPWKRRYDNVVLMGHFNTPSPRNDVIVWAQKWREVFSHVVVRGSFSKKASSALCISGVETYDSNGEFWDPPITALVETRNDSKSLQGMDGAIYLSSDTFLNMSHLVPNGVNHFPTEKVMFSSSNKKDYTGLRRSLKDYTTMQLAEEGNRANIFLSEFLFIPTKYAQTLESSAKDVAEKNSANVKERFPNILESIRKTADAKEKTIQNVPLCTTGPHDDERIFAQCLKSEKSFGVFYPAQVSMGYEQWSDLFDRVTFSGNANQGK